ncbi:MAG: hypothetical protein ACRDO2_00550 [Nocardioidaceae bacterium]
MPRPEASSGRDDASGGARLGTTADVGVPTRAAGVTLIGEIAGSGYRTAPALVRRADGQMIQLTPLLYLVLEAIDGQRAPDEIAKTVSAAYGRSVSARNIETLVDEKLRPLGVVRLADGSEPQVQKSSPLLALRFKYAVTDPRRTQQLTRPFALLFRPLPVVLLVGAFLYTSWWLLFEKGLASATHEAFHQPGLLLLIFAVTVLSAGFHEFGHASAARYGGSTPGTMGMGFYLFWPAFYTDVTDSYRLGRGGRIRTDLGGLYFNAIVAVGIVVVSLATGYDALLLVVATQILQMLRQLMPAVRFDGYHLLADLTGVPDLYHRIRPTLTSLLPWRWRDSEARALKPWARAIVTVWCLTVVPLMFAVMAMMVVALPRLLATAWVSAQEQWAMLASGWGEGDLVEVLARALAIFALVLPILGLSLLLWRFVSATVRSVWRRSAGKPVQRAAAVLTGAALIGALAWAWWPGDDRYRPITPDERGTLTDLVSFSEDQAPPPQEGGPIEEGFLSRAQTAWPADAPLPTRDKPSLAMVMVPRTSDSQLDVHVPVSAPRTSTTTSQPDGTPTPSSSIPSSAQTPAPSTFPAWVFPFDIPLPPEAGDNQALAVNTTDDTITYDIAFALVWVENPSDPVLNTNEAYAFASCARCAAVAVAFQVVLVVGEADVVVPQNLAGALNYNCVQCLTYALATQLVVTLDGPLSDAGLAELNELWAEIAEFARSIADYPLAELRDKLTAFEQQILDIIAREGGMSTPMPSTPTAPDSTSDGQGPSADDDTASAQAPAVTTQVAPDSPPSATATSDPIPEPTSTMAEPTPTEEPAPETTSPSPTPTSTSTSATPTTTSPSP